MCDFGTLPQSFGMGGVKEMGTRGAPLARPLLGVRIEVLKEMDTGEGQSQQPKAMCPRPHIDFLEVWSLILKVNWDALKVILAESG